MYKIIKLSILSGAIAMSAGPAIAGEITGNGKWIDIRARSECAYSGQNDTPLGDPAHGDPGGRTQNYGEYVGEFDIFDPSAADPRSPGFPPIPGFSCNPNRGTDLHAGG